METSKPLTKEQMDAWTNHVLKCFPEEACAFIVNDEIFPVKNTADEPTKRFRVDPIDQLKAEQAGEITGFLHSHPHAITDVQHYPAFWPSGADMEMWLKSGSVRWGISATEGETVTEPVWLDNDVVAPLVGRTFIHGIWDCYALIRDYYNLELGIKLPNYARGMEWWRKGEDMYSENFKDAGFYEITAEEVKPGDVVLMSVDHKIINHGAIVLNTSTLLHHTYSRNGNGLSGEVPFGKWSNHVMKYLRHKENNK